MDVNYIFIVMVMQSLLEIYGMPYRSADLKRLQNQQDSGWFITVENDDFISTEIDGSLGIDENADISNKEDPNSILKYWTIQNHNGIIHLYTVFTVIYR